MPIVDGQSIASVTNELNDLITDVANQGSTLAGKANTGHTHLIADTTGLQAALDAAGSSGGPVTSVAGKTGVVTLVKADVGLPFAENTGDLSKPISTATQTALNGKADINHTQAISTITGLEAALASKADVSHTQAISTVTGLQTALDGKQPLDTDLTAIAALTTTAYGRGLLELANVGALKTSLSLVKADVNLALAENTADLSKPISTATQTALNGKADTSHTQAISTVTGLQTALDSKVALINSQAVITYASTVNLDITALNKSDRTITLTGDITVTTSNRVAGSDLSVRLTASGGTRSLAFPAGWRWLGVIPVNIASGKVGLLVLKSYGTADTDILASFGVEL